MTFVNVNEGIQKELQTALQKAVENMPDGQFYDGCDECFRTAKCVAIQANGRVIAFTDKNHVIGWIGKTTPSLAEKYHGAKVCTGRTKLCQRVNGGGKTWDEIILDCNRGRQESAIVFYEVLEQ